VPIFIKFEVPSLANVHHPPHEDLFCFIWALWSSLIIHITIFLYF